ncbi:uncharacterized protein FN964_014428 [Alca torda]
MADQRLRTPKMPMEEEANAYSQPDKGLLSLQKRRQVAHRQPEEAPQGRQSPASSLHGDRLPRLPCPESSQATGSRRVQSDSVARSKALPCNRVVLQEDHQPRQAATAGHAPTAWPSERASTCCKLPPLPPAPSASPAVGWETASSTEASSCLQPVPPARGINDYKYEALRDTTLSIVGEALINSLRVNQRKVAQSNATLQHAPARQRRPSLFRRAPKALPRAFCCSCIMGEKEQ